MSIVLQDNPPAKQQQQQQQQQQQHLSSNPILWSIVGVTQTLLTAGIVFGWASLLPVLREEGVDYTPEEFSRIFTFGAVGNYVSTLAFGLILDHYGPKWTAIVASVLFSVGCVLCHLHHSYDCLLFGFGLLGFSGPGIQMPTLHLANLFSSSSSSSSASSDDEDPEINAGGGGGAIYMSAQAAAFDGGTAIFALVRFAHQQYDVKTSTFFILYLIIPCWVLVTALYAWPDEVIANPASSAVSNHTDIGASSSDSPYFGPGSPYLTPKVNRLRRLQSKKQDNVTTTDDTTATTTATLYDAPLQVVLKHSSFWILASWVSVHILKLNFVVATINDQLNDAVNMYDAQSLIGSFGAMLPFGFVILPVIAWLLQKSTTWAFQLTNVFGLVYGLILVYFASIPWLLKWVVFPVIATSRQMVYSTIFHQIGVTFGFANYGVLLGLTNILVSAFSMIQNPLVTWSEILGDYKSANTVLLLMTLPLFATGFVVGSNDTSSTITSTSTATTSRQNSQKSSSHKSSSSNLEAGEETPLLMRMQSSKDRSSSF
jgi:MFS family permease